jgi:hypothetical protein
MRWTRQCQKTNDVARGRRSRVVLTPRRWRQVGGRISAGDGDKKARSPGRARRKPLKPSRREGRVIPVNLWSIPVCFLPLHTGPRVQRAPGFPCSPLGAALRPLIFKAKEFCTTRTLRAARMWKRVWIQRHCERSEAIQKLHRELDCFVASLLATTSLLSSTQRKQGSIVPGAYGCNATVQQGCRHHSERRRHGVWVPASAGTTGAIKPK